MQKPSKRITMELSSKMRGDPQIIINLINLQHQLTTVQNPKQINSLKMKIKSEVASSLDEITNAEWKEINKLKLSGKVNITEIKKMKTYYESLRDQVYQISKSV